MKEFITACPRNCYSTCSFKVQVENNIIKAILPYQGNLATPEGPCIKGQAYVERSSSPDRILTPLLRKEDGSFKAISSGEALSLIATKLADARDKHGSHSVLWIKGSGNSGLVNDTGYFFWKAFGGVTTTYGNLCWPAGLEAVRLTLGSVKHNVPWDIANASTIVIWGKNPAETNIQEMAFIGSARKKGAKVILIDPRRTPTADKADIHYRPIPGTDAVLALACCGVIIREGLADIGFIKQNVLGFKEFSESSLPLPEEAGSICGIPAEEIRSLARLIATGSPVTFIPGYGLQRYTNGGQTIRSLLSLAIITGNLGKKGSGFNYANLQSYIYDVPKEPLSYYPDKDNDYPFRRVISMATLGKDVAGTKGPDIGFIWVERANPVLQIPDSNAVKEAFKRSGFTVVVDQFITDTARLADVILPAKDIFEQSDIIGSYWSPYVQFKPKVVEPSGSIMPESEIYWHLARYLGLDIDENLLPPPGNDNTEKWLENRIKNYSSLTLDDLKKGPVLAPGLQAIAYEDMVFDTPSGKIELYCNTVAQKWGLPPLPGYMPLESGEKSSKYPLVLMCPNGAGRIHSQFGNLNVIKMNTDLPALEISPDDAEERLLSDDDMIKVFNDLGSIVTRVRITGRLGKGLVVLHNGIWLADGGGGNTLTSARETDIGHGAAFHGNRVEIVKLND